MRPVFHDLKDFLNNKSRRDAQSFTVDEWNSTFLKSEVMGLRVARRAVPYGRERVKRKWYGVRYGAAKMPYFVPCRTYFASLHGFFWLSTVRQGGGQHGTAPVMSYYMPFCTVFSATTRRFWLSAALQYGTGGVSRARKTIRMRPVRYELWYDGTECRISCRTVPH